MLPRNHRQESLSRAYIQAVAALAGMSHSVATLDYGIDLSLLDVIALGSQRIESGYRIDVQAKSTTLASCGPSEIRYDLAVSGYECLRFGGAGCPRLLVVLVLPDEEEDWLTFSEEQLILRRCAYWLSLRGRGATKNRRSIRVSIPRTQVFSPQAVRNLMDRIKAGGEL